MADENAATIQQPMAEEDNAATIPPESRDENPLGSASEEENTSPIQLVPEEENAEIVQPDMGEEEDAATIRPESGEENAVVPESEEENTETILLASEEKNAATIQSVSERKKAKPIQPERKENEAEPIRLELPTGRVKKIMKLDRDINKVNSEALHLVSCSAQLFLQFLAEGSGEAAMEKKRKIVKLEHIRTAAKRHRATRDFLVDELPMPSQPPIRSPLIGAALAPLLTIQLQPALVGLMTSFVSQQLNPQFRSKSPRSVDGQKPNQLVWSTCSGEKSMEIICMNTRRL